MRVAIIEKCIEISLYIHIIGILLKYKTIKRKIRHYSLTELNSKF